MYIISKFHDYYDGVMRTGIDKTIVYNRHEQVIDDVIINLPESFHYLMKYDIHDNIREYIPKHKNLYEVFLIGFCGKPYIGWRFYFKEDNNVFNYNFNEKIVYDLNELKKYLKFKTYNDNIENNINSIKNQDFLNIFRKYNTPVFVYEHYRCCDNKTLIINPQLKKYQFFKIFDSYGAFQEIQMFISGVLGNKEKEIVEVGEKYKVEQHGFNKWSFRREAKKRVK